MGVVVIIGILAAVAIPAYQTYTMKARLAEALNLAYEAQQAVSGYYDRWGRLPLNNAAAGLAAPADYRGQAVTAITVKGGVVVVDLDPTKFSLTGGNDTPRLYLRPAILRKRPTAALIWSCGSDRVPEGFALIGEAGGDMVAAKFRPGGCN